jgi:hypothetical protein
MNNKIVLLTILFSAVWFACEKDLNITDFKDEFGNYQSELKVEGLLQLDKPEESIIRIIKTSAITDTDVFNGRDDDGDGRVDEYDEVLPLIQDKSATVKITNVDSGEEFDFEYVAMADSFRNGYEQETHTHEVTHSHGGTEEDNHTYEHTHSLLDKNAMVAYGGYKPVNDNFFIEDFAQYQLEIYSKEFDKTITSLTTVYPPVSFIDTLFTFNENVVTMKDKDKKEIFWKSDLNVSAYYITFEELYQLPGNEWESEYVFSYESSRNNDLTKQYRNVSIGKETIWGADAGTVLQMTVQALSPEYGHYLFSSLPLNDPQRSNLRDEEGNPVMGCFGAVAANSIFIVIED